MPRADPEEPADPLERISQLEAELASTRRYLQSIIEELRSANEEAQSTNEELLSSNEELQTAKEELQASNEELQTLNAEMEGRNAELKVLTDDLLNLLASLQTPILMLDASLRIRRFTQVSEKLLNLIPADIGRPVSDLKPRINVPQLEEIIRQVVDTLAPEEKRGAGSGGALVLPSRAALSHQRESHRWRRAPVGRHRRIEEDPGAGQARAGLRLGHRRDGPRTADGAGSGIANRDRQPGLLSNVRDVAGGEPQASPVYEVGGGQFDFPRLRDLLAHVAQADSTIEDVEIERDFERIGRRTMLLNARRIEQDGRAGLILLAFEDVTERKRAAEARYRRLFEAAKDGMLIVDAETGEITDANPFLEALFGYRREELVGRKVWEVEPLRDIPDLKSALERIRGQDMAAVPRPGGEIQERARGARRSRGQRVHGRRRRVVQFNIRDITERKRFDRQLQHTQKLESLGVLAGGIAHDFNNLLTGIMGNASLGLTELPDAAPDRRYLREIVSASQRAADLTRQMLAYAGKGRFRGRADRSVAIGPGDRAADPYLDPQAGVDSTGAGTGPSRRSRRIPGRFSSSS